MSALIPITPAQQVDQQCLICYEEASPERPLFTHPIPASSASPSAIQSQPILHPFHFDCLYQWTETLRRQHQESSCPLCREHITVLDIAPHEDAAVSNARHNWLRERRFSILKSAAFNAFSAAVIGATCGVAGVAAGMGAAMAMANVTNVVALTVLAITFVFIEKHQNFGAGAIITTGTLATQVAAISQAAAGGLAAIVAHANAGLLLTGARPLIQSGHVILMICGVCLAIAAIGSLYATIIMFPVATFAGIIGKELGTRLIISIATPILNRLHVNDDTQETIFKGISTGGAFLLAGSACFGLWRQQFLLAGRVAGLSLPAAVAAAALVEGACAGILTYV